MDKLMKFAVAFVLGGISTACLASGGNFFVNADLGQANYRVGSLYSDSVYPSSFSGNVDLADGMNGRDTAGGLRFGYRWHSVVDFGVEAGYVDLGHVSSTFRASDGISEGNYSTDLKSRGWLLGGNLKYDINDLWYLSARGGWFHSTVEDKGNVTFTPDCPRGFLCPQFITSEKFSNSSSGSGDYVGAGTGLNLTSHLSLGLSYDDYHAHRTSSGASVDVGLYSVSAEYRY